MAMPNFVQNVLLPRKVSERLAKIREERANRKNVKLIKAFLKLRKEQQSVNTNQFDLLKEQRKSRAIDKATYERLRKVLLLST